MGCNGKWNGLVIVIVFIDVIRTPYSDPLLDSFVVLQRSESRLIKNYKTNVCNNPLMRIEERKQNSMITTIDAWGNKWYVRINYYFYNLFIGNTRYV